MIDSCVVSFVGSVEVLLDAFAPPVGLAGANVILPVLERTGIL